MNILIDIGHPGHVHLFRNFAHRMISKGHSVHFTVRDKEFEIELLKHEGFSFKNIGRHYNSKIGKAWGLIKFTLQIIIYSRIFKPDIFLSHGSIYTAFASFFLSKPNIALEDTGNWEQVKLYLPFTKAVLTGTAFLIKYGEKQIKYDGYHELAYLHPNYFLPDKDVRNKLGLSSDENYAIIRLVGWKASHDKRQSGISVTVLKSIIELLSKDYRIFISSERTLPESLEKYKYDLPAHEMHNALAFATLFIGEGATMASECAMLGTPAVYINSIEAFSIDEQEALGLLFHFKESEGVVQKVIDLLSIKNLKRDFIFRKDEMLKKKIDVTAFLEWFIENYPRSFDIMKENPDYQLRFN